MVQNWSGDVKTAPRGVPSQEKRALGWDESFFFHQIILVNGDGECRRWIWGVVNSEKCDFLFLAAEVAEERGR